MIATLHTLNGWQPPKGPWCPQRVRGAHSILAPEGEGKAYAHACINVPCSQIQETAHTSALAQTLPPQLLLLLLLLLLPPVLLLLLLLLVFAQLRHMCTCSKMCCTAQSPYALRQCLCAQRIRAAPVRTEDQSSACARRGSEQRLCAQRIRAAPVRPCSTCAHRGSEQRLCAQRIGAAPVRSTSACTHRIEQSPASGTKLQRPAASAMAVQHVQWRCSSTGSGT